MELHYCYCERTKQALKMILLLMFITMDSIVASDLDKQSESHRARKSVVGSETWKVSNNDANARLYSELIDVIERMNILTPSDTLTPCLQLHKISRELNSTSTDKSIDIHLVFTEASFQKNERNAQISYKIPNTNDVMHIVTSGCGSSTRTSSFDFNVMARKQGNSSDNASSNKNATVVLPPQQTGHTKTNGGLSRTQVVVIATCSAVIGTFFLIAGIMRLTSFVKRYRANREQALNVARRASSMGLNGSNMSSSNLRRDSCASKASRQSNTALQGGGDIQVNQHEPAPPFLSSHNSSPTHISDHKPLLPVNSLPHKSEGGSSHGSLDFIDEELQNRQKGDAPSSDSEMESEDDPLLRKSPDSGSSIDVPVPMIFQNVNEVMASRRNTEANLGAAKARLQQENNSMTSRRNTEPNVKGPMRFNLEKNGIDNVSKPNGNILINVDVDDVIEDENEIESSNDSSNERKESSNDVNMEEGSDEAITSENDKSPTSGSLENASVESECDSNSVPYVGDDLNDDRNLSEAFAVTVGLTQSDGSLSENRNYFYGNQTEYALDNYCDIYAYNGYSYPFRNTPYNYYNCLANDEFSRRESDLRINDETNGPSLNLNQNGSTGVSPSELSVRSLSISKDSSGDPLLSISQNSSSPPSGGGYPVSGTDNLALVDSGEDDVDTGSAQCTVVPHIVPLAEYHKISPGFSESIDQS